ncbi:uncharacterized protein YALI1_A07681g [Yarrowia lipolytica]|uniref:Uncharacterized protein n=1 Tax=Yarrowia lipolytica TaxID=4952 RepID=A0A1D8N422_YARLL|nr:hypothetical protein YALI1_A07681g [Yarrowia lipolytica]
MVSTRAECGEGQPLVASLRRSVCNVVTQQSSKEDVWMGLSCSRCQGRCRRWRRVRVTMTRDMNCYLGTSIGSRDETRRVWIRVHSKRGPRRFNRGFTRAELKHAPSIGCFNAISGTLQSNNCHIWSITYDSLSSLVCDRLIKVTFDSNMYLQCMPLWYISVWL